MNPKRPANTIRGALWVLAGGLMHGGGEGFEFGEVELFARYRDVEVGGVGRVVGEFAVDADFDFAHLRADFAQQRRPARTVALRVVFAAFLGAARRFPRLECAPQRRDVDGFDRFERFVFELLQDFGHQKFDLIFGVFEVDADAKTLLVGRRIGEREARAGLDAPDRPVEGVFELLLGGGVALAALRAAGGEAKFQGSRLDFGAEGVEHRGADFVVAGQNRGKRRLARRVDNLARLGDFGGDFAVEGGAHQGLFGRRIGFESGAGSGVGGEEEQKRGFHGWIWGDNWELGLEGDWGFSALDPTLTLPPPRGHPGGEGTGHLGASCYIHEATL